MNVIRSRRAVLLLGSSALAGTLSGCLDDFLGLDSNDANCDPERVVDETGSFDGGQSVEVTISVTRTEIIAYDISRMGGSADPRVMIQDPDGEVIHESPADRSIEDRFETPQSGEYLMTIDSPDDETGEWHIVVDVLPPSC